MILCSSHTSFSTLLANAPATLLHHLGEGLPCAVPKFTYLFILTQVLFCGALKILKNPFFL